MTGSELVELARTQIGKRYVLGANVDLTSPDPPVFDCAEFASWLAYQATNRLVGCTNNGAAVAHAEPYSGGWASDIQRSVVPAVGLDEAMTIAGAVLVRAPKGGRIGHVAISDGDGGTVEAHSTKLGVIAGKARGRAWTHAGLIRGVDYAKPDPIAAPLVEPAVLRIGARGADVVELQRALKRRFDVLSASGFGRLDGLDPGPDDGDFGPLTQGALIAWQTVFGLVVDGELVGGGETARSLRI